MFKYYSTQMNTQHSNQQTRYKKLYPTHVPTSVLKKVAIAAGSSVISLVDPERGDMVAALGETTGKAALVKMLKQMKCSEEGRFILKERPIIDETIEGSKFSYDYLQRLPADTLGGAYYKFMSSHGFLASGRTPVKFVDDEELAYVMTRYRQVHDFFHVLSDLPTSVAGELGVKWLELTQTGLPMTALSGTFGMLNNRLTNKQRIEIITKLIPWALRCGKTCRPLMTVYFEKYMHEPIDEVRNKLLFEKAPVIN
ncbi:ubiquinone biosynthesis protein, mitochondrial [Acrasis kona]|uniref:Ubiquinone biosynthesis protein COQ4 homolog, mitochondrial n=1 Tax=Acrasis kona TaxID=1008807 RepID=A0AAW2ZR49_9EUKA